MPLMFNRVIANIYNRLEISRETTSIEYTLMYLAIVMASYAYNYPQPAPCSTNNDHDQ